MHVCPFFCLLPEAPMSVKEVLQSLVDDNMVDCEKVGTSNYYWAFPSKALNARKHKLQELQTQVKLGKMVNSVTSHQSVSPICQSMLLLDSTPTIEEAEALSLLLLVCSETCL